MSSSTPFTDPGVIFFWLLLLCWITKIWYFVIGFTLISKEKVEWDGIKEFVFERRFGVQEKPYDVFKNWGIFVASPSKRFTE